MSRRAEVPLSLPRSTGPSLLRIQGGRGTPSPPQQLCLDPNHTPGRRTVSTGPEGRGHVSPLFGCGPHPPRPAPPWPNCRRWLLLGRRADPCLIGLDAQHPPTKLLRAARASVCRVPDLRRLPARQPLLGHRTLVQPFRFALGSSWHPSTLGAPSLMGARDCQVAAEAWAAELADSRLLTLPSWLRP
ncbi:hypothetical protein NDU88_006911 [Pleurodeles waltl]|uniref:Uncharacterized protein n=1 Tax=Pleurodeles waltl TaxID=8319 RepID=A0AAV7N0L2_PLEWA|nr:hypothetical protein NDU88_006911 [Pleurodeles waltl]